MNISNLNLCYYVYNRAQMALVKTEIQKKIMRSRTYPFKFLLVLFVFYLFLLCLLGFGIKMSACVSAPLNCTVPGGHARPSPPPPPAKHRGSTNDKLPVSGWQNKIETSAPTTELDSSSVYCREKSFSVMKINKHKRRQNENTPQLSKFIFYQCPSKITVPSLTVPPCSVLINSLSNDYWLSLHYIR